MLSVNYNFFSIITIKNLKLIACCVAATSISITLEPILQTEKIKSNTTNLNSDDKNWIEECASEVYILGGEEIYAIRDSTNRFGFVHTSQEKCYECSISNSINSGSDGHTFVSMTKLK